MKQLKQVNLIALVIFIALLAIVFSLGRNQLNGIHETVLGWFAPLIRAKATVVEKVDEMRAVPEDPAILKEEVLNLRRQVAELRLYREEFERQSIRLANLERQLNYSQSAPFKLISAKVLERTTANWWSSLVIDKGFSDKVSTDAPVLLPVSLGFDPVTQQERWETSVIGKTGQVARRSAVVILLTDERCIVAARVEGVDEARGLVSGRRNPVTLKSELVLQFIDKNVVLTPGQKVFSSGEGGVFPQGLFLGTIQEFKVRDLYAEALLIPPTHYGNLEDVFVIEPGPSPL